MDAQADVVVIGAGIVGCSVAYHLARLGWGAVTVVDQGPLFETGGSTSHAPGLVFQTNASRAMTMLARQTVALYAELSLAGSACFEPVGSLEVATTAARWDDLQRKWGWARALGLRADLLTPEAASVRLPLLDPGGIRGALAVPADGIARPVRAAEAMAVAALARSTLPPARCGHRDRGGRRARPGGRHHRGPDRRRPGGNRAERTAAFTPRQPRLPPPEHGPLSGGVDQAHRACSRLVGEAPGDAS